MKLNIIIIILLYICLFFGLAQQIYGTNPKHFSDKENTSDSDDAIIDANEQFEENNEEMKKNRKGKAIVEMIISPKFLKIAGRKENYAYKEGIGEQISDETLNSPKYQSEILNESEHSSQSDYYENEKAIVPAECMECNFCSEIIKFDQLCFCDHLMTERIFGSGSSSNQQRETHAFCIECLKYYTNETDETVPFAKGGIGLKCLVENCENPIPWHEIRQRMPDRIESIRALEKHCDDLYVAISASLCLGRDHSVVASSSNSVEKNHEESGKMKNKAINKKISSPKLMNILKGKGKEKVPDECVECPICYELVMIDKLCFCDHLIGDTIFGSSSNNEQEESHAFCRECLKGYTKAALETKPFASGWLGLKCMAEKCENPIPWQEIKKDASLDELKAIETLESQCAELSVSAADLCLERCPKCNYAIDMDGPIPADYEKDTNNTDISERINGICYCLLKLVIPIGAIYPIWLNDLKFHCPECHYEMCRKCNEKWADEHKNLTCEQFAKQLTKEREKNFRNNKLSEKVVNRFKKCPKCKSPFEKNGGAIK